ncbi:hypothetical protein P5V15_010967 [Pogonomyrmex californicus]
MLIEALRNGVRRTAKPRFRRAHCLVSTTSKGNPRPGGGGREKATTRAAKKITASEKEVAENGATSRARRVRTLLTSEHEYEHDDDNDHDEDEDEGNEGVEE